MTVKIESSWKSHLEPEFEKDYFKSLVSFLRDEYATKTIYPPGSKIFNAFDHCPFQKLKVVIVGQDPYHGPGQANGLCFSVADGVRQPPSLQNIFKEVQKDLGQPVPQSGNLERWADQGVLLLNATLTVEARKAGSHQNRGWEQFTDTVLQLVSDKKENIVFILWGAYAQKKGAFLDQQKHLILKSPHPSPFSAHSGFFGSKPFSRANQYLSSKGLTPINW
ncbi:uracil-DNA glycosylase [Ekhidna sp.]|uniref:uracil-DNA glycosylase n=1 Tax=Ekhidna sp. TaxID=2608089 RepID=UPI0032EB1D9B